MRSLHLLGWTAAMALALGAGALRAQNLDADEEGDSDREPATAKSKATPGRTKAQDEKKFRDFNEVTKGSEKIDGFFTLHRKDEHLYAEIKPQPARPADPRADRDRPGHGDGRPAR